MNPHYLYWRIYICCVFPSFIHVLLLICLYVQFNVVLLSAVKNSCELLLTSFDAVLRTGGGLSIRQEARHGEDLFPTVLHCLQGAAGWASRRDLATAKVVFFSLSIRVPQVGWSLWIQAALEALGWSESRLIPAWCPIPIFRRGSEGPEGADATVIQHANWRAV